MKMESTTVNINPEKGDITEQVQKAIEMNRGATPTPTNRKQRRAMAKRDKKKQKQLEKYFKNHPEAMKIELDEDAVKKVEEQENNEGNIDTNEVIDINEVISLLLVF